MFCTIWYYLYNLKSVKNTHGGVLLLVKLQTFITYVKIQLVQIFPSFLTIFLNFILFIYFQNRRLQQ